MERFNASIERLARTIGALIDQRSALERENARLASELNRLSRQLERSSERQTGLEKEVDSIKLASAMPADEAIRSKARAELDGMLREIDQCLALLND
jgi:chromosome segregation ATPase